MKLSSLRSFLAIVSSIFWMFGSFTAPASANSGGRNPDIYTSDGIRVLVEREQISNFEVCAENAENGRVLHIRGTIPGPKTAGTADVVVSGTSAQLRIPMWDLDGSAAARLSSQSQTQMRNRSNSGLELDYRIPIPSEVRAVVMGNKKVEVCPSIRQAPTKIKQIIGMACGFTKCFGSGGISLAIAQLQDCLDPFCRSSNRGRGERTRIAGVPICRI